MTASEHLVAELEAAQASASDPDAVAEMLDCCLEVCGGQRVLELGTGTGYSTALLAHRIGAAGVTTVEIDPVVAAAAKTALEANGYPVTSKTPTGGGAIKASRR